MNYLFFVFIFITTLVHSQEVKVFHSNENEYFFEFNKEMDGLKIERFTNRMLSENEILDFLLITTNKCVFKVREDISNDDLDKTILYCISKFGYTTYQIKEQ